MKALKIIFITSITLISFFFNLQDVPETVKKVFSDKFPTASSVSWERESKTEWEAGFKLKGVKYSAVFLEEGTWVETEYEIAEKDIPKAVLGSLAREFPGYTVDEAEKLETKDGIAYELEIEKGREELEIIIDTNGKILKQWADDEDED